MCSRNSIDVGQVQCWWGMGVCHFLGLSIAYTIKAFDIQYDPKIRCWPIHLVLHEWIEWIYSYLFLCFAGYEGVKFDWSSYLRQHGIKGAPSDCFRSVSIIDVFKLAYFQHLYNENSVIFVEVTEMKNEADCPPFCVSFGLLSWLH